MTKRDENALKELSMSQCCALEVKAADNIQDYFNKTAASTQGSHYSGQGLHQWGPGPGFTHVAGCRVQLQHRLGRH